MTCWLMIMAELSENENSLWMPPYSLPKINVYTK